MTVYPNFGPTRQLEEQMERARPDLLMPFARTLKSAEADAFCRAIYGTATSLDRTNRRNGLGPECSTSAHA